MPKLTRQFGIVLLACGVFCILGDSLAWACPNCKDALAGDPEQAGLIRGLFWSIIFLLSMPFLITAGLGGYFYWLIRKARLATPLSVPGAEQAGSPFSPDMTAANATEEVDVAGEMEVAGV